MDRFFKNNASKSLENRPKECPLIELNDDTGFDFTQNADIFSGDPFNHGKSTFGLSSMSVVSSPVCENLLGNLEGKSQSHAEVTMDNSNDTITTGHLLSNFWIPQIPRSSYNSEGSVAAEVQSQGLGGAEALTSHFHDDALNSEDATEFSSLFGNVQTPQVDRNITNYPAFLDVKQHSRVGTTPATDTARCHKSTTPAIDTARFHSSMGNSNNLTSVASQFASFNTPQSIRSNASVGVNTVDGLQSHIHGGAMTANTRIHGLKSNNEVTIPLGFNNLGLQTERSSINIGSNIPHATRRKSRIGASGGTSHGQGVRSNATSSRSVDIRSHNAQSPQINKRFIQDGGRRAAAIQAQRQVETAPGRSRLHGVTTDANSEIAPTLFSNLRGQQINRNLVTVPSYVINGPQNDGNFLSLGGNIGNQTCPDNADNADKITSDTNLGVDFNTYISHRGNMGNQTGSNNGSRANTNVGIRPNPFTNSQAAQVVPRQSGMNLGPSGNGIGAHAKESPYMGFHGHPGVAIRPYNSIPSDLPANVQARLSSLPLRSNLLTGIASAPFSIPLQQTNVDSSRHLSNRPSSIGTAARTLRLAQSGHPLAVNSTTSEVAKEIIDLPDDTSDTRRRGKRLPTDGISHAHSPKVHLRPSITGKPVPVHERTGLTRVPPPPPPLGRKLLQPTTVKPHVYHLKWTDPREGKETSGEKCHLCKRDLTFTATGPVSQPPVPPAVAVLPCRHTFHDECLQRITPDDDLKDPPCIPCAIGA